jgi:UDP-N-acetylglucosamine 4,6-dehydratase
MTYLITGGTGTLGTALVKRLIEHEENHVIVFSRDEFKQWNMANALKCDRVKYVLGDVRDRERVKQACEDVDVVIHTAAYKHVWAGEQHPWEVIHTNIDGTRNVVDTANYYGALMTLVSSDKAVQPTNLYGCTKMAAEALTLNGNQRVVRYGNVFGSRGSILHRFNEWAEKGHSFRITDLRMTRFVITVSQAVDLVLATSTMEPGTLNIPELPAMRIIDLAHAFDPEATIEEIGIQKGEKLHELLSENQSSEHARKLTIDEIRDLIKETPV